MVFSSVTFLFYFLPIVILLYFLVEKKYNNIVLLIASLIFYAWGEGLFVLVLLLDVIINYVFAFLIDRTENANTKKKYLFIAIASNLAILFYYKYIDFVISNLNSMLKVFNKKEIPLLNVVLPIGLSFFIFQGMSYVIDVYRKEVPVQKSIFKLALYISMFPQLIAGPIVRYKDVVNDIDIRKINFDEVCSGTERFIIGIAKKVMLADILAGVSDNIFEAGAHQLSPATAWLGAICYTLQIYYDFSGYSDMAIGLGKILGFHFPENFILPYTSLSVTEFWRRWHITLGSWFRDYLYIPLGGNRRGNVYINLMIVFILTGLWHGANYTFVFWGLWHGFFVVAERFFRKHIPTLKISGVVKYIYTMLVVIFGWIFFRSTGLGSGFRYIKALFGILDLDDFIFYGFSYYIDGQVILTIMVGILISTGIFKRIYDRFICRVSRNHPVLKYTALALLLISSAAMIINGNYSPFIYFRF